MRKTSTRKNRVKRRSGVTPGEIFKTLAIISVAGLLAVVMVYAYNVAMCADCFRLKNTIVRGCNKVSKERILELAGISSSMNILAVNLKKMALGIENNPWVRTVTIGREFPDRLVIDVVERNAVALLKNDKEMYVVDSDGEVFKKFEAGDIVDVPVFTGCYRNGSVNETLMEQAFEFLDCLSEGDNFPREWNVSEIYSDDVYAFSVFTDNHLFLNLGFGDYETKLKRLNRILTDLKQRGLDKTFLSIDLVDCSRIAVEHRDVFSPKNLTGDRKIEI